MIYLNNYIVFNLNCCNSCCSYFLLSSSLCRTLQLSLSLLHKRHPLGLVMMLWQRWRFNLSPIWTLLIFSLIIWITNLGFSRFDLYSKISWSILIFFLHLFDIDSEVVLTISCGFGGALSIFYLIFLWFYHCLNIYINSCLSLHIVIVLIFVCYCACMFCSSYVGYRNMTSI